MTDTTLVTAVECTNLCLRYPYQSKLALDNITLSIPQGAICGLLGRNGAGKTSLMALLAGFRRPTSGSLRVFGAEPYENAGVAGQVAFIYQNSKPAGFAAKYTTKQMFEAAATFRPNWDADLAAHLCERFALPLKKSIRSMSKGQVAALHCTIGLASRCSLTIFDEAYLGMDAVYRKVFIDELLADYLAHQRTILFATHYIGEMERLFSEVIIIDGAHILLHEDADKLRENGKALQDTFISLTLKEGEIYDHQI